MSESEGIEINGGRLQDFTIDQLAGALALSLGAVGTLLLVIWQSRCACRCRLGFSDKCYIFDCSREPPPLEDIEDPNKDPRNKDKKKPLKKSLKKPLKKEEPEPAGETAERHPVFDEPEPEPEPEPESAN